MCPRRRLLEAVVPYHKEPKSVWAMFMGTAIHEQFHDKHASEFQERKLSMEIHVPLTLPSGNSKVVVFPVIGSPDNYSRDLGVLTDVKTTTKEFIVNDPETGKRKWRELPEPAHVVQTNIYRMLLEHNKHKVKHINIWYARTVKDAPRKLVPVPLMDLDDVYLLAVDAARPLALARETGELPECSCVYRSDREFCAVHTDEWDPCLVKEAT